MSIYSSIGSLSKKKKKKTPFFANLQSTADPGDHFVATACAPVTVSNDVFY
jgi:hypothetical protein